MNFLLLLVLSFMTVEIDGSGVVFLASPTTIQSMLTDSVSLRCSLKDSSTSAPGAIVGRSLQDVTSRNAGTQTTDIEYVTSMVITKSGVDVASLTEHIPAHAFFNSSGISVSGSIGKSQGERGFLQVTLADPTDQQTGEYKCDITGVDKKGHSFYFSQTVELVEKDITLNDVVRSLYELKKENAALKQQLNTKVFFSAGVTSHLNVPFNHEVIYDKVFSNVGAGYDVTTGLFTCPVAGYYYLEISGLSQAGKIFMFELQQNGQPVIVIYGTAGHSHQGSTNSVLLQLHHGDVLRVASIENGSAIYGTTSYIYSTFNGYLVAID